MKYAVPTQRLINDVADEIDISDYSHALRDNDIRHIKNSHGENTNEKYPVTSSDIKLIPWIVQNYDKVFVKTNSRGKLGILYVKVTEDNVIYYVEAVTEEYHNEKLLVNKQMIKTGVSNIPNLYGLYEAINKKMSSSQYLADLNKIREAYVQDVKENYSKNSITKNADVVNNNYSTKTDILDELLDNKTNNIDKSDDYKFSISKTKNMDWIHQIYGLYNKNGQIIRSDTLVVETETPLYLRLDGIKNLPLAIPLSVVTKATNGKDRSHSIKQENIIKLQNGIRNADIVIKNSERNSFVFLTNIKQDGYPVLISFLQDVDFDGDRVHKATSIHLQIDVNSMLEALPSDATVYLKNKNEFNDTVGVTNNLRSLAANIEFIDEILSQNGGVVNNNYSTNVDMFDGLKELNVREKEYIQRVCNQLGCQVVFEDLREIKYKGEILSPDGYIGSDGVIHINTYAENPIGFILKHELTHFGEKSSRYIEFVKTVKKSKLYKKWITEKTGESDPRIAEYKYKQAVANTHSDIYGAADPKTEAEMIADFVGEMLFTEKGRVYSKTIPLTDVAWINGGEGQYAEIGEAQKNTAESDSVVRFSERDYSYKNRNASDYYSESIIYTYDFLVSQKDMKAVTLPATGTLANTKGKIDDAKVLSEGKKNILSVGIEKNGKTYVKNLYTNRELRIDNSTIKHGLSGTYNRHLTNARIASVIGSVVQNAIPINALKNTSAKAEGTYAMVAYCRDNQNREFIAVVTVEQHTNNIDSFELYDVAHAVSGRQKNGSQVDTKSQGVYPIKATTISIADLLTIVNDTHQSILSDDVLSRLGQTRNPDGAYSDKVLFSQRDPAFVSDRDTSKPINSWEKQEIEKICNKFGIDIVFEDLRDMVHKGEILWTLAHQQTD